MNLPGDMQALPEAKDIHALQQAIVAALKAGARFATAHKEGGSRIVWTGSRFLREDYGDFPDRIIYADEAAFLAALRRFFDWQVSRDCYPGKPTEVEAWRGILNLLYRD
jgi:hypothetical protein